MQQKKIKVGVIGLGVMGYVHLEVYRDMPDVEVVAVADMDPGRFNNRPRMEGNIEGDTQSPMDLSAVRQYHDGYDLIRDPSIDLVDVCVQTSAHVGLAKAVLASGKHLLLEKPIARTYQDALEIVESAKNAKGYALPAHCIRFWPGWSWLKETVLEETYGKVLSGNFGRLISHPKGEYYQNGELNGGAILDLHIHDTDFIHYCFGVPDAVFSRGYSKNTTEVDHLITQYIYNDPDKPKQISAEGGWAMAEGYQFEMKYQINFEQATVSYTFDGESHVTIYQDGKDPKVQKFGDGMGYEFEIKYLIDCIRNNRPPEKATLEHAAISLGIIEAENRSVNTGNLAEINLTLA